MDWKSIPEPRYDPPEDKVIGCCDLCGGEIYEGETIYEIDGKMIHEDCLAEFAADYFAHCKVTKEAESYANHW